MASTAAVKTFATQDAVISDLQDFYSTPGTDQEILRPMARGLDPNAVTSVCQVFTTQGGIVPGQTALFTLQTTQDFVHDICLHLDLSAIVPNGTAGNAWRDDLSGIIQQARVLQNNVEIHRFAVNDWLPFRNQCLLTLERQLEKQITEGLGLTLAQRQANAAAPSSYDITLPTCLDGLGVPMTALGGQYVQIEITFKPALQWQTWTGAGVPTFSISNCYLNVHGLNVDPAFIARIQEYSRVKPYIIPMMDNAFQQDRQTPGSVGYNTLVNQFKGLAAYVGWWIRDQQQVADQTGQALFQWNNSDPWIDSQIFDRTARIMSSPNSLPYSYVRNTIRPREFMTFANPATNGVEFAGLYPFALMPYRLSNTIGEILQLGCYTFQTTQAATMNVNMAPAALSTQMDTYEVFFNALVLQNGRLSKVLA